VNSAIEEVCTVVKGIAQKKSVSVNWAVAPELGNVTLDQQKFKQVCYNLLANAVKFTDSSGRVELNALARDDERFELRVKDTGIGIKKKDMQRLFREFEQLESGNVRRFEGTGLGLALTKKLSSLRVVASVRRVNTAKAARSSSSCPSSSRR
jgi:signal transduction histidine kinase